MIKVICNRCKKELDSRKAFQWLEDEDLSPKFCRRCYFYILDNYEEGMDIESME